MYHPADLVSVVILLLVSPEGLLLFDIHTAQADLALLYIKHLKLPTVGEAHPV